jgi:hypothetical protein
VSKNNLKKKKSVELPLNTLVIASLMLIVLVTLVFVYVNFHKKEEKGLKYEEKPINVEDVWENDEKKEIKYNIIQNSKYYSSALSESLTKNIANFDEKDVKSFSLYRFLEGKLKNNKQENEIKEELEIIVEYSNKLHIPLVVSTYLYSKEGSPRFEEKHCSFGPFNLKPKEVEIAKEFLKINYENLYKELNEVEKKYSNKCEGSYSCLEVKNPGPWMVVTCKNLNNKELLEVIKLNIAYKIAYLAYLQNKYEKLNLNKNTLWILVIASYYSGPCLFESLDKKLKNKEITQKELENIKDLINFIEKTTKDNNCKDPIDKIQDFLRFSYQFNSIL